MGYDIIWQPPNGLIKRHFGHVTSSEVLAANIQAEADHRFDSLKYVINDFSDCTGLTVLPSVNAEIAAIDNAASASNPNIRIAIVATHPELVSTGNSYANNPLTNFTTRVFSSMKEAQSWLGLSTG